MRIFCREKPPVGGISVKEHFEINLVPLTIGIHFENCLVYLKLTYSLHLGLTKKFYITMMKFCFPERETENQEYDRNVEEGESEQKGKRTRSRKNRDSNFYIHIDDVEKMKVSNVLKSTIFQYSTKSFFFAGKSGKE